MRLSPDYLCRIARVEAMPENASGAEEALPLDDEALALAERRDPAAESREVPDKP